MLCSNCGASLKPDAQFCSSCGQKKQLENVKPVQAQPIPEKTQKSSGSTKIITTVAIIAAAVIGYTVFYPEETHSEHLNNISLENKTPLKADSQLNIPQELLMELSIPVEALLKAFQDKDTVQAYQFVSKEFQEKTSLESFQEFVQNTPILTDYKSYNILKTTKENNKGFVITSLISDKDEESFIEFTLTQENHFWKIQSLHLDKSESNSLEKPLSILNVKNDLYSSEAISDNWEKNVADNQTTDALQQNPDWKKITSVVEEQLKALSSNDNSKAYQDYTSKEFQQATTLEQYINAVDDYPLLKNYSKSDYDLNRTVLEKDHASLSLLLSNKNDHLLIDYSLVKVGEDWKIWGIEIKEVEDDHLSANKMRSDEDALVTQIVDQQLNSLRTHDLKKAYELVSKDFQTATPYPAFEEFVKNYPILTQNQKATFSDVTFEKDKANLVAVLQGQDVSNPVEYTLIREGDVWKIYGFRVLIPDQDTQLKSSDKGEIVGVIADQLAAMRSNDLEKAYSYTSKEFQEATLFPVFGDFIKNFPVFKESKSANYSDVKMDGKAAIVNATVNSDKGNAEVEYRLVRQDSHWKIISMNVLRSHDTSARPPSIKSADLLKVIEDQLAAIRNHDIQKAYQDFASKDFKEATSFQTFEQFVHKNPVIGKNKSTKFDNLSFENDIGTFEGTLTSDQDEVEKAKYRLTYEDGKWKILSINVMYSLQSANKPTEISKIAIGTEVDLEGVITKPLTTISDTQAKITANLFIRNGHKGDKFEVILEHVETSSKVPAVTAALDKDGESVVSFVFTPPTQGWPKGNYKLHISSSTGLDTIQEFKVQ